MRRGGNVKLKPEAKSSNKALGQSLEYLDNLLHFNSVGDGSIQGQSSDLVLVNDLRPTHLGQDELKGSKKPFSYRLYL